MIERSSVITWPYGSYKWLEVSLHMEMDCCDKLVIIQVKSVDEKLKILLAIK